ncbi:sca1 complex scaffold protein scaa [Anaeramoeba flamelloides]|uniref:Sca1 complex scaffold protein scaa n=1 Tax=Anaeramoeba flamelloides TaxID=1746091 RepID=A0ABQ8Z4I4_9EUKA|nr:sca1 complex scaffold protein scaa [Anaeramoeba flamelloides]
MNANFLNFSKEFQGLRSKYNGPYIDTNEKIEKTKLEQTYGQSSPIYLDSQGNLYDLFYLPITKKPNEKLQKNNEETKAKEIQEILNDPLCDLQEEKMKQINQLSSLDLSRLKQFPEPDDFETFEEYEQAALNWKKEIQNTIGTLQLPDTTSSQTYQFPEQHFKQKNETDSTYENDFDEITETIDDLQTDLEGSDDEGNVDEREDLPEDHIISLTDNDQLEIFKLLEKDQLLEENTKLKNSSIDLNLLLNPNDPWESTLIPKEPKPEYYKTFSEYERVYRRWSQIAYKHLNQVPMHARQLQQQALLKPNKKKLKKKKKTLTDFSRDYVTWRKMILPKLLNYSPDHSFFTINKLNSKFNKQHQSKSSSNFNKELQKNQQNWSELNQDCKENISKIFDDLGSKIKFNLKIYSSNITPIVGKFTPIIQKKGKTINKKKLSNRTLLRSDLAKETLESRSQKPIGTGSTLIDYIVPSYDLSSPISWELKFEESEIINNLYSDLLASYYLNVIKINIEKHRSKNIEKLINYIEENLMEKNDELGKLFAQNPEIIEKYLLEGISSNSSTISFIFLFMVLTLLKQDSDILLLETSKETLQKFSNLITTISKSKFVHTKIAAKIILNELKEESIASKFIGEYTKEKNTIINNLFSHRTMYGFNMTNKKRKIYFNLDQKILTQMEQYVNRRKEIFDQYEAEDEKAKKNKIKQNINKERIYFENGLISYKNIQDNPTAITKILSKYFKNIYRTLSKPNSNLDLKDSVLLSENFYNEIIARLKKNLNTHLPTINVISHLLKEMVHCLLKLRLIIGTYRSSSNQASPKSIKKKGLRSLSNYNNMMNKKPKSPRSKSKYSSMTLRGLTRSGTVGSFHSSHNNILTLYDNQNKINPQKRLVFKENRILQIINLIQNCPTGSSIRRNLLCTLSYLMKERTIYLTIYSSSSFFQNLKQFCAENTDFKFNRTAWKLFYQVILYHSETCPYLIKSKILKSFIDIITVSSGIYLINQLHYINKIFRIVEIESKRILFPNGEFKRYYESNPLLSYKKDLKSITNWFVSTLQYTRFCRIHRSIKSTYSANFIVLSSIFYTFIKNKNCSKIFNELKSSQEYSDVLDWYLSIFKNNNLLRDKYSSFLKSKKKSMKFKKKKTKKKTMYEKFTLKRKNTTGSIKKKKKKK